MKTRKSYWKLNLWELRCTVSSLQVFSEFFCLFCFFLSFFFLMKKNFKGVYQCHLLPTWIKKTENNKSDIHGEKKISLLIIRVNKHVQFWVGISDLMHVLLTRQEQTPADTDVDLSFLGLPFSILSTIHAYTTMLKTMTWCVSFNLYWQSSRDPIKYKPCWLNSLSS